MLQISQEKSLLSSSPRSNVAQFWLHQELWKNGCIKKCFAGGEAQALARQAELRWPWAATGGEKSATGPEIPWMSSLHQRKGPRRCVCSSGIWNHCNVAKGSSWTKNFGFCLLRTTFVARHVSAAPYSTSLLIFAHPQKIWSTPPPSSIFQEAVKKQYFCLILNKLNPVGGNNIHNKLVSCNNSRFAVCSS